MEARHDRDPPVLLHFSEDPALARFVPHIPATNLSAPPMVWAIDTSHAPLFWFPRDCPRITFWSDDGSPPDGLGPTTASRVHVIEAAWVDAMGACELYVYRFEPEPFRPWPGADGYWVCERALDAPDREPVGDLWRLHAEAGIEVRVVPDLSPLRVAVQASGYRFSMSRLGNARS